MILLVCKTGVQAHEFGSGGHPEICAWLLEIGADANAASFNGNTVRARAYYTQTKACSLCSLYFKVMMWSVWGGSQQTSALLVDAGADPLTRNAHGCGVGHWAAAGGGGVELCSWLRNTCNVCHMPCYSMIIFFYCYFFPLIG